VLRSLRARAEAAPAQFERVAEAAEAVQPMLELGAQLTEGSAAMIAAHGGLGTIDALT